MGAEPLQHALLSARWWPLQERDEAGKLRAEIESIESPLQNPWSPDEYW